MQSLENFINTRQKIFSEKENLKSVQFLFTDIDDTLTESGQLHADAYAALWNLKNNGIQVIPVTGRPAGWCEMIARMWPVIGVVGENGAFYFRYHNQKMKRYFQIDEIKQNESNIKLKKIAQEVLQKIPGTALASDQFCRMMDVAIDFCEDVPALSKNDVQKIVKIFESHGATAKVSSIHVNAWFGSYDKLSMCKQFVQNELQLNLETQQELFAFSGDSPNDEPMFAYFQQSFAVANIQNFINILKHKPKFVASKEAGSGFVQIAECLLNSKKS